VRPEQLASLDMSHVGAIAVLGGAKADPLIFHPRDRLAIDALIASGRRVFCEYCADVWQVSTSVHPAPTHVERLVFCSDLEIADMAEGDLLDDQGNARVKPVSARAEEQPLLQYAQHVMAHAHTPVTEDTWASVRDRALWFETPNLLVCTFRMANYARARFARLRK